MATLWMILAGLCLALAIVRLGGLDRSAPLVQLVSFTPYVAVLAAAVAATAAATAHPVAASTAGCAALIVVALVLPRCLPTRPATGGIPLRVLSSNLLYGRADPASLLDLAKRLDVDVIAVQEFTPQAAQALDDAGIAGQFPYRASYPTDSFLGSGLYSRHPMSSVRCRTLPSGVNQAAATIVVPAAGPVSIESAHPAAPVFGRTHLFHQDYADQPDPAASHAPTVLLGDFNATVDHVTFRRLLARGFRDAATLRGRGLVPTWPFLQAQPVPWITLDHILVDHRTGVAGYAVHRLPGTDHRAVSAQLRLPTP